ncbi:MAG TPA: DUF1326 domain-containing protein [Solirubrobacteraceae bacterium]|nr:DUF1326 domain-containing protein [Solirubrobacteraceae bacterium]
MAYRLSGTYMESCSCDVVCPCGGSNLDQPATYDRCQVLLAFHVQEGEVDGVEISDVTVAMLADTPAQMTDGNWRVGLFLDERANEEQRAKLTSVFAGEQGGPAGLFAPLVGEMLGVEVAPIEFADDGLRHTLRIGDDIELDIRDFESVEEGRPMALEGVGHPAGPRLNLALSERAVIKAFGLEIDNTGRNAHSAPFAWQA